jgi:hypothetical protein
VIMELRTAMNRLLIAGIAIISTAPLYAQSSVTGLAIFAAIRLASSLVSSLAGLALKIDIGKLLAVRVPHYGTVGRDFGSPPGREAARGGHQSESMSRIICPIPCS